MEEGLHNLTDAHYRKLAAVSQSFLNRMEENPALAKAGIYPEKKSMRMGTLLHLALCEPTKLKEKLLLQPDFGAMQSSTNRAKRDAWLADQSPEAIVLTDKEMHKITVMIDSVRRKKLTGAVAERLGARETMDLLADSSSEITALWIDGTTRCKAKLDVLDRRGRFVMDVKKTKNASMDEFMRSVVNFNYHRQAAWYLEGATRATGRPVDDYLWLAVEEEPVILDGRDVVGVHVMIADEAVLSTGHVEIMKLFEEYKGRVERDDFPFYSDEISVASLPSWKVAKTRE